MINWKVRLKNKTFLVTFSTTCLTFIYTILGMFGIVPPITQSMVGDVILSVINILVAIGILIDPTTSGVSDSHQALLYDKPKDDKSKF